MLRTNNFFVDTHHMIKEMEGNRPGTSVTFSYVGEQKNKIKQWKAAENNKKENTNKFKGFNILKHE